MRSIWLQGENKPKSEGSVYRAGWWAKAYRFANFSLGGSDLENRSANEHKRFSSLRPPEVGGSSCYALSSWRKLSLERRSSSYLSAFLAREAASLASDVISYLRGLVLKSLTPLCSRMGQSLLVNSSPNCCPGMLAIG